jgi:ADP-ribosylglycohydrolase
MDIKEKIKGTYYGWFFGPGGTLRRPLGTNYRIMKQNPEWVKVSSFEEVPSDYKMYDQLTQTQIVHDILIKHGEISPELFRDRFLELNKSDDILHNDQYGPSSQKAVKSLLNGANPRETGKDGVTTGAAMRCMPIGIYFRNDLNKLIHNTCESCIISHNSDVAVNSALAVNIMIAELLNDVRPEIALDHTLKILAENYDKRGESTSFARIDQRIEDAVAWIRGLDFESATQTIAERIGYSWYAIEGIPAGFALYFATKDAKEAALMAFKTGSNHTAPEIACALHGAEKGSDIFPMEIIRKIEEVNNFSIDKMVEEMLKATVI